MSDPVLLFTGIAVFSLMLIGVVLTALEYHQLQKKSSLSNRKTPGPSTAEADSRSDV